MEENSDKLEKNFFYRLVKVTYILFFLVISIFIIYFGWNEKPKNVVDTNASYITCSDNKSYSLNTVGIYIYPLVNTLDTYGNEKAFNFCLKYRQYMIRNNETKETVNITYYDYPKYNLTYPDYNSARKYTLTIAPRIEGSWQSVFQWWFLGIGITYFVLNIIKETLLYIFLGKKFSWKWFTKN